MGTLGYILGASVAGGLLSVVAAAAVSFATRPQWVSVLISFAIGALLGASFLEVLPHALGKCLPTFGTQPLHVHIFQDHDVIFAVADCVHQSAARIHAHAVAAAVDVEGDLAHHAHAAASSSARRVTVRVRSRR